jgi:hypothetical protein
MSPEQVHGEGLIDGRSDIYTLGIILFEMLTGRKPFRADTPVKLMMAHVLNPVPSILDERPDLPPAFDTILQKTLSKKPEDRYAQAHDLTEALTLTVASTLRTPEMVSDGADHVITDLPAPLPEKAAEAVPDIVDLEKERPEPQPFPWYWIGGGVVGLLAVAVTLYLVFNGTLTAAPEPTPLPTTAAAIVAQPKNTLTSTPTSSATPSPTRTPPATPTATATRPLSRTPTVIPVPERLVIGRSAGDSEIEAIAFGNGENGVVFIGGFHAGFAPSTVTIAEQTIAYFSEHPEEIPANVRLYVIANANPDSSLDPGNLPGRLNANGVDLNRNWDCRWQENTQISGQFVAGGGGSEPFSEPEVAALSEFLVEQQPVAVVFWEARVANGLVSPGSCGEEPKVSQALADTYGEAAGYQVSDFEALTQQTVNGDSTNWLDDQEIPAVSVLLQDYTELTDWEANLAGILAVVAAAE